MSLVPFASHCGLPEVALDPFGEDFLSNPVAHYPMLREAGPVFYLSRYGIYGMARFEVVKAVLEDYGTYCSGRGVGLSDFAHEAPWRPPSLLLETDPPEHDSARSVMNKIVSLSALRTLRPTWSRIADALAERVAATRHFDGIVDVAERFPLSVFPDAIGIRQNGRENLLPYASAAFNAFGPRNQIFHASYTAAGEAIRWVAESCRREHLEPGGWGMAVHEAAARGECSEDDAERLVRSFLSAGIDTTINGIGNMLYAFAVNPCQWQAVRAEPMLIKKAFEESLRWLSTAQTFFRTTTRPTRVAGHTIPEGKKVLLFLAAANRDPRKYCEADEFIVNRTLSGHVGFGFGIHACLGQMVARLEAEVVLEALVRRIKAIRLAGPAIRRLNNTLLSFSSVPLEIELA